MSAEPYPRSEAVFLLGEAMSLILNSAAHRDFSVDEIKTHFVTPIMLDQFRLYRSKRGPIGIVTWAEVAEEISRDLRAGKQLQEPRHIKSGRIIWLLEFIAPFGQAHAISRDLRDNIFAGRRINAVRNRAGGKRFISLLGRTKNLAATRADGEQELASALR